MILVVVAGYLGWWVSAHGPGHPFPDVPISPSVKSSLVAHLRLGNENR